MRDGWKSPRRGPALSVVPLLAACGLFDAPRPDREHARDTAFAAEGGNPAAPHAGGGDREPASAAGAEGGATTAIGSGGGGSLIAGTPASGSDVGGSDVGGSDVGGSDVGGPDVGGSDVGGSDVGGSDVGGSDVGGSDVGGSDVGGSGAAGEGGVPRLSCPRERTECGGFCVNLAHDPGHCGDCDNPCLDGEVCFDGSCSDRCLGSARCGASCVDTDTNPKHCGGCNEPCSFVNGVPACLEGKCHLAGCSSSYVDLDGDPSNGCECRATASDDPCDGVDNDCDGLVDRHVGDGVAVSTCACHPQSIVLDGNTYYQGPPVCAETACTVSADGVVGMSFCHTCQSPWPWSVCVAAEHRDFSAFDADAGNEGAIAIEFCLDRTVTGQLNVWYGQNPWRKRLRLLTPAETQNGLGPGCYTRYFLPADACFGGFDELDSACRDRCGKTGPNCQVDFSDAPVLLTAEGCVNDLTAHVTLESVTYYPPSCACRDSDACDVVSECRPAGLPASFCPDANPTCAGVCAPATCQGEGEPCQVQLGEQVCHSTITCIRGKAACPVEGCVEDGP